MDAISELVALYRAAGYKIEGGGCRYVLTQGTRMVELSVFRPLGKVTVEVRVLSP